MHRPRPQGSAPTAKSHGYSGARSAHAKTSVPITVSIAALTMVLTVRSRCCDSLSFDFCSTPGADSGLVRRANAGLPRSGVPDLSNEAFDPGEGGAGLRLPGMMERASGALQVVSLMGRSA